MLNFLPRPKLTTKVILLGAGSVLATAGALVLLSAWQSGHYQSLAQKEVDQLIAADLDHIAHGVYNLVQTENDAVQAQVSTNLNVARHILSQGGPVTLGGTQVTWDAVNQLTQKHTRIELPAMHVGKAWLGQNTDLKSPTPIVDTITNMIAGTATIFQRINAQGDMLRVATTVRDSHGRRAIGTYIPAINPDGRPNPVVSTILQGKAYNGRAYVVNAWYLTAYQPILDAAGNLIGMFYVGVRQDSAEARVRSAILQTRVGKTGYVYVLGGKGAQRGRYIISQREERDGENIWDSQDSSGHRMIQDIVEKALGLRPGQMTTVRYLWKNPLDPEPRWKIARIMYYQPWDWIIGTSVYEDELQHYRTVLTKGRQQTTSFMVLAGMAIALLVGLGGVALAWTITRPIRQITQAAETITRGDFGQTVDVRAGDEIGSLANTFNYMTAQLRQTLAGLRQENRDREKAEKALREREAKLQSLFRSAPIGLGITKNRYLTEVNDFLCQIVGSTREELIGHTTQRFYVSEEEFGRMGQALQSHTGVFFGDYKMKRKDGSPFDAQLSVAPLDPNDASQGVAFALMDLTQRRQIEEQLRQQAALLQATHDAILVWDRRHGIRFMNRAAEALAGVSFDQAKGQELSAVLRPRTEQVLSAAINEVIAQGTWTGELMVQAGDGSSRDVASRWTGLSNTPGEPTAILITCNDITEQKRFEQQYLRAQRLDSVGTLASGVAHDLNNILTPIIIGVDTLETDDLKPDTLETLDMIKESACRGADTVSQLLTFARGTDTKKGPVDPHRLLNEVARLAHQTFPKNIQVCVDGDGTPVTVQADPTQLHQVLMNLCVNARDAMREGGVLALTQETKTLDEEGAKVHPKAIATTYVVLGVGDSGEGIPPEVLDRIFDPFYTTKPQGKGTGLGLATVLGIVENHGGFILVESKPGEGTTFQVFLPATPLTDSEHSITQTPAPVQGRGELVLVVDDETAILRLTTQVLRRHGYSVLAASNASETLHHYEQQRGHVRAVLTDIMMPFGDGRQLIAMLAAQDATLPIIAMSGQATSEFQQETLERGATAFIRKPFSVDELLTTLARVIK